MSHSKHTFCNQRNDIVSCLTTVSPSMVTYVEEKSQHRFTLWYKLITHSDITNRGKRNGNKEGLEKNLLYYLSVEEMKLIEASSGKPFETAKQSNIGLPIDFYQDINIPRIQRRKGVQKEQHTHVVLNDNLDVFLVNDSLTYFTEKYTANVMNRLGKKYPWSGKGDVQLSEGEYTPIQLTQAIHGLGTSDDVLFATLRLSIFLNDTIYFLVDHDYTSSRKALFILLEKNPLFYTLSGEANEAWSRYLQTLKRQNDAIINAHTKLDIEDEKSRKKQAVWKRMLAQEMMNYTTHEGEVFCPFTNITANFEDLSSLFIASHIKRYADSEVEEAFDINNGLLLCANADALFDKHLITVTEEKEIKYSFLLENDKRLIKDLKLNQDIFAEILNDKRMEYMADHRRIFFEKEKIRKGETSDIIFDQEDNEEFEIKDAPKISIAADDFTIL